MCYTTFQDGGTPLFVACQCGHYDIVQEFIRRGSNVNSSMKVLIEEHSLCLICCRYLDISIFAVLSLFQDKATPLFIASQNGHLDIIELLLNSGAYHDAARTDGASPLWIAAQMGHDHIVKILCRHGAKVDQIRNVSPTFYVLKIIDRLIHFSLVIK